MARPATCVPVLGAGRQQALLPLLQRWRVTMQDGGYHVPFAHKSLAAGLDLAGYESTMHERVSIQRVAPARDGVADARLAGGLLLRAP